MNRDVEAQSKLLALILRHQPESIGLTLNAEGWALVAELVERARSAGHVFTAKDVVEAVRAGTKRRFELSLDGQSVRAIQGHSTSQVKRQLQAVCPPPVLFHGTATRFLTSISARGLLAGVRHHVHISADRPTALQVGRRHGQPVVLPIDAAGMHAAGHEFHLVENGVWLTSSVPAKFLVIEA
nr:RNA 2'-phosphotransferase [Variovorax boronicumulans]